GRFRALETIREYGIERLADAGELVRARVTQAEFLGARAREMDRLLRGPRIMEALSWFDDEEDNIASALRYSSAVPLASVTIALVVSCAWYWLIRDRNEEARDWLDIASPLAVGVEGDEARILSLVQPLMLGARADGAAELSGMSEELTRSMTQLLAPLSQLKLGPGSHELLQLIVPTLQAFGAVMGEPDWMTRVRLPSPEALGLDPWPTAVMHVARAAMAQNRGDVDELGSESRLAREIFTQIGDLWGLALSEQMYSLWFATTGQLTEALEMGDSATEHMRQITSRWDLAQQQGLGIQMLFRLGRADEARGRIEQMLRDAEAGGNARTILQAQLIAATADVELGDLASAGTRLAAIDELRDQWHNGPGQLVALVEVVKGSIARRRGDLGGAENHLREAVAAAIRSHDSPVIGAVALSVATWALVSGKVAVAVRAVNLSTALIGYYDASHPEIESVVTAADAAKIERPSTRVPERPISPEALTALLSA
ncbi:MAG TPA: hypothetical protein VIJ11_13555, partial [Galbitalea sp.]